MLDGGPLALWASLQVHRRAVVLVIAGERAVQETYDEGRLAERIMLAAWAHGVGSSIGWIVGEGQSRVVERFLADLESGQAASGVN